MAGRTKFIMLITNNISTIVGQQITFIIATHYGLGRSGFGGLEVACWPLVPKFAGSHPAKAVGFLGQKNPQHTFLRRGSKAVGPIL